MEARLGINPPSAKINSIFNSISYRVGNLIIDPGDEWEAFRCISLVLLTHAHFDHIYGLNRLMEISPEALVYTNEHGREMLLDAKRNMSLYHETPFIFSCPDNIRVVSDCEIIDIGDNITAQAIFTPGHNPSCISWIIGDAIFTGDAYIPGLKTVTNLPGGDKKLAAESEELIKRISIDKTIYSGHLI